MSRRRGSAFWLMGGLLGTLMIAAGAPSPLYGVYQATWHFSAATLTAVFAVYAVALLAAFLVVGRLSDHLGRKPVIIAALLIEAAAMACFAAADSTGWLYTARVVQGIATGMATGAISAALVDLAPRRNPQLAPLVNSAAPTMGLAAGALGSSLLVHYGPAPMHLVFWLLLAAFVAGIAGTLAITEPGQRRPGRSRRCGHRWVCPARLGGRSPLECRHSPPAGRSAGCTSRWGRRWRRNCCTRRTRWPAGRSSSC